jgi:hypothetical protein
VADVQSSLPLWNTTAASNGPSGTTVVGAGVDNNFQEIQKVVRGWLATKGANIASASTTDLGAVEGLSHTVTGTTTITNFGTISAGVWKVVIFAGALTLTHNATSLILPGAANITTAAGDVAILQSEGSGNWRCWGYQKASGYALAVNSEFADNLFRIAGSADSTKKLAIEVDGNTTGVTRTLTPPDFDARLMTQTRGANVASAGTINLDTATGDYVHLTGTTTCTAITLADGRTATTVTDGVMQFTHGASLPLITSANITSAAGDIQYWRGEAAGVVRMTGYQRANGQPLVIDPTASQGASLVYLDSKTASASASLAFTSGITSTYDEYVFEIVNCVPATNNVQFNLHMSVDGGSNYQTAAGSYGLASVALGFNGTSYNNNSSSTTDMFLQASGNLVSSTSSSGGYSGIVRLFNPSSTTQQKHVTWNAGHQGVTSPVTISGFGMGFSATLINSAVNAVRFIAGSGNLASGTIRMYGVKKA